MFSPLLLAAILLAYAGGLLCVALYVERRSAMAKRLVANPLTYTLALGVYCTSWTFYGSVGSAVQSGLLFMTVYLGPAVACALWGVVLPRFVRIRNAFHITSIADFLSARYGKSQALATLASATALLGLTPYIALQIKSILGTFSVITGGDSSPDSQSALLGPVVVTFLCVFTIVFGARRLDPSERHPGLVATVALESVIKLAAFLAVGLFVTYGVNDGLAALFERAASPDASALVGPGSGEQASYMTWTTYMVLSASAILFLPRQFHMAVVENQNVEHVRWAMWLLPLYLLLINIFVLPISLEGILSGLPAPLADTFVLRLPLHHGRPWLSLFVFIGGFSAAMGMIMVSTMALATMATNHLLLPLIHRRETLAFLRKRLLGCRWTAIAGILVLAYLFERVVGDSFMLVGIGMMSFAAALQFAPAMLGAVFWRGATTRGAMLGLCGGFLVWTYCLILPALAQSGLLPMTLLDPGPLGLRFLRPEALFGLAALDPLSHTVFWSMLLNVGLFVFGSILCGQSQDERQAAQEFIAAGLPGFQGRLPALRLERNIGLRAKRRILVGLAERYLPPGKAEAMVERCVAQSGLAAREEINVVELAELSKAAERALCGPLGAAPAHQAVAGASLFTPAETAALSEAYSRVLAQLKLPPEDLLARIDFHQEREELMRKHSEELERRVEERTGALAVKAAELEEANRRLLELDKLKSSFLSSVSHELRTPLTSILGFTRLIDKEFRNTFAPLAEGKEKALAKALRVEENLRIIEDESRRLTRLINDVLDLSKIEEGRLDWRDEPIMARGLIEQSVAAVSGELAHKPKVSLRLDIGTADAVILADRDRLQQVLINLLNNAAKFTEEGVILVSAARMPNGGLRLAVSDTGPGIPTEDHARIFDKFYQVVQGDTLMNKPRGTGLGLSICKQIVEHYGGSIHVESTIGAGSTFVVELPPAIVSFASARPDSALACPLPDAMAEGEAGFILVVDDDPSIRSFLSQLLAAQGYETATARDGEEALRMARARSPNLITMDLMMPGMDGREAINALRRDPVLAGVPVLVLSILPERCSAGGDAALGKPFDQERLLSTVAALIARGRTPVPALNAIDTPDATRGGRAAMALCPDGLAACALPELTDQVEHGFTGTVVVRADASDSLDWAALAPTQGVQVIIMPDAKKS